MFPQHHERRAFTCGSRILKRFLPSNLFRISLLILNSPFKIRAHKTMLWCLIIFSECFLISLKSLWLCLSLNFACYLLDECFQQYPTCNISQLGWNSRSEYFYSMRRETIPPFNSVLNFIRTAARLFKLYDVIVTWICYNLRWRNSSY